MSKSLRASLWYTCSAVLPTSFPPPAPWDLRISLRPVPAPWRTCTQTCKTNFYFTITFILFKRCYKVAWFYHFATNIEDNPMFKSTISMVVFTSHEGLKRSLHSSSQKLSKGHSCVYRHRHKHELLMWPILDCHLIHL